MKALRNDVVRPASADRTNESDTLHQKSTRADPL
jgi:hypothetical protein